MAALALLVVFVLGCGVLGSPAAEAQRKILVVFVHGFRGADMIAEAQKQFWQEGKDLRRAAFAEFLPYYDAFVEYAKQNPGLAMDFLAFKYDTYHRSNIGAGRFLNMVLKGEIQADPDYPYNNTLPAGAKLPDYSEIYFITQSNGSLVVREAILQAFGLKDDSASPGAGSINYARVLARAPLPSEQARRHFLRIERDEALVRAYRKATVFDISPILGGSAYARSATRPIWRFAELNPFNNHNQWLFSETNVWVYNQALADRHYTFFIVGDSHTGGIWKQLDGAREPGGLLAFAKFTTLIKLRNWKAGNLKWLIHFERARGKDTEHHIEFCPAFSEPGRPRGRQPPAENPRLRKLLEAGQIRDACQSDSLFQQNFSGRLYPAYQSDRGGYARDMSTNLNDYCLGEFASIYRSGPIYKAVMSGFFEPVPAPGAFLVGGDSKPKPADKMALNERHTILAFYKPLLNQIGASIFGRGFEEWFAARGLSWN